jgi:hypothetical protein
MIRIMLIPVALTSRWILFNYVKVEVTAGYARCVGRMIVSPVPNCTSRIG